MKIQMTEDNARPLAFIEPLNCMITDEVFYAARSFLREHQDIIKAEPASGVTRYMIDIPEWVYKVLTVLKYDPEQAMAAIRTGAPEEVFSPLFSRFAENQKYYKQWVDGIETTLQTDGNVVTLSKIGTQYLVNMTAPRIKVSIPIKRPSLWWVCNIRACSYDKLAQLMWLAAARDAKITVDNKTMPLTPDVIEGVLQGLKNEMTLSAALALTS